MKLWYVRCTFSADFMSLATPWPLLGHLLATPGQLLATLGHLLATSWLLLVAPGCPWPCLAVPGRARGQTVCPRGPGRMAQWPKRWLHGADCAAHGADRMPRGQTVCPSVAQTVWPCGPSAAPMPHTVCFMEWTMCPKNKPPPPGAKTSGRLL